MRTLLACVAIVISAPCYGQSATRLYDQGVEARLSGDHVGASALLRQAVEGEPGNVDAKRQRRRALLALDHLATGTFAHNDSGGFWNTLQFDPGAGQTF